jgi:predicted RecA/RadA family phage recombinase
VQIKHSGDLVTIGEMSAVALSSIKKMTTDELLLALAMEDMINAPKSNVKENSVNTAVYGEKEGKEKSTDLSANDFGIKRLNGAKQLAENGLKESGIIFAKETYRKYPETKQIASYRIYFADILDEKGLYTEALGEYLEIKKLDLNKEQSSKIEAQINHINKILLNN